MSFHSARKQSPLTRKASREANLDRIKHHLVSLKKKIEKNKPKPRKEKRDVTLAVREEFEDEDGEKLRKLLAVVFEYRREITAPADAYAAKHGLIERFNSMEEDDNLGLKNHYRGLMKRMN